MNIKNFSFYLFVKMSMLILLGCMEGGIGVERGECNGSDGLGDKKGSTPSFCGVFFTILA